MLIGEFRVLLAKEEQKEENSSCCKKKSSLVFFGKKNLSLCKFNAVSFFLLMFLGLCDMYVRTQPVFKQKF